MNKKEFDNIIKDSLRYNNSLYRDDIGYPFYFNKEYIEALKKYLVENNIKGLVRELLQPSKANSKEISKMCSVASSARLCLFYTRKLMEESGFNIELEKTCDNGITKKKDLWPHLDAWCENNNTYYECKCHEIFGKHDKLKCVYKEKLISLFNIDVEVLDKVDCKSEDGKIETCYELKLKHLGIENDNRLINELHLDVKQLICHLIGIQHSDKEDKTLKYIFFTPPKNYWQDEKDKLYNEEINKLYNEVEKEWNMIMNCESMRYFFKNNKNISISYDMVPIDTFDDIIVKKLNYV